MNDYWRFGGSVTLEGELDEESFAWTHADSVTDSKLMECCTVGANVKIWQGFRR